MKNIIIGTDFSASSTNALALAAQISKKVGATLHIIHAFIPPFVDPNTPVSIINELHTQNMNIFKEQLDKIAQEMEADGVRVSTSLVFSDVPNGLIEKADEIDADLLIIGKTGENFLIDRLIGSNAVSVVKRAKRPVLMVPKDFKVNPIQHLVYGTQLEQDENKVLSMVKEFASSLGALVSFVHIDLELQPNINPDSDYIASIKQIFGTEVQVEQKADESVVDGLQEYANSKGAQVIVVAAEHRNFFTQLVEPSQTRRLVRDAELPVLVYYLD